MRCDSLQRVVTVLFCVGAFFAATGTLNSSAFFEEYVPNCIAPRATDPGGAGLIHQCYRSPDGSFHIFHGSLLLEARPTPQRFKQFVQETCRSLGVDVAECDIIPMFVDIGLNAVAGECEGKKMIFVDETMESLFGKVGGTFVVLHELGHHICGHLDRSCALANQLEADAFAGAGLRVLNVSFQDASRVTEALGDQKNNLNPNMETRAAAVIWGWTNPDLAIACEPPFRHNEALRWLSIRSKAK